MKKAIKLSIAFFLALGTMISLSNRPSRAARILLENDDQHCGISQHFEAAWNLLASATEKYEQTAKTEI